MSCREKARDLAIITRRRGEYQQYIKVICAASIEDKVPPFLKGCGEGWVTAEYSLLPRSTKTINMREAT